jgi:hypothetical protein
MHEARFGLVLAGGDKGHSPLSGGLYETVDPIGLTLRNCGSDLT